MSGFYEPGSPGCEPDIDDYGARSIIVNVIFVSALFFGSLAFLFVYFRWEADREIERKILTVEPEHLNELRKREAALLAGKPVKDGGAAISVDAAMKQTIEEAARAR